MANGKTIYWSNAVLAASFNGTTLPTLATGLWFALYSASSSATGGGTEVATGAGNNYTRVNVTPNTTNFTSVSNGQCQNAVAIVFPQLSQGASGYTTVQVVVFDATTAGNARYFGDLQANKAYVGNDQPSFPANAITFTEA
jgi:hypothetical protein